MKGTVVVMLERLKEIFFEFKEIDGLEITEETVLSSELGLSSIEFFEFAAIIEDEFDVRITDKELMKLRTVGDVIECVNSKL